MSGKRKAQCFQSDRESARKSSMNLALDLHVCVSHAQKERGREGEREKEREGERRREGEKEREGERERERAEFSSTFLCPKVTGGIRESLPEDNSGYSNNAVCFISPEIPSPIAADDEFRPPAVASVTCTGHITK